MKDLRSKVVGVLGVLGGAFFGLSIAISNVAYGSVSASTCSGCTNGCTYADAVCSGTCTGTTNCNSCSCILTTSASCKCS